MSADMDDRDQFLLACLRARDAGVAVIDIPAPHGISTHFISTATNRVADADRAYDPAGAHDAYAWRVPVALRNSNGRYGA